MKRYYVVIQLPTWLLCERVVKMDNGYLLYEYDQENNRFVDSGYAKDLEHLQSIIRARYGFHKSVYLLGRFEEVVKMFDTPLPRIIHLTGAHEFCVRRGDILFSTKWDYDDADRPFVKKMEWWLDGKRPETIKEALVRLNEYAEKHGKWVVLREWIKSAVAYEVYPIP
jgi:hypothetical protein